MKKYFEPKFTYCCNVLVYFSCSETLKMLLRYLIQPGRAYISENIIYIRTCNFDTTLIQVSKLSWKSVGLNPIFLQKSILSLMKIKTNIRSLPVKELSNSATLYLYLIVKLTITNDIRCLFTMVSVIFQIFADTSGISMERLQELVFQTVLPKTFCCAHLSIQSIVPVSLTIYVFKNLGFGSMVSNFGFMFFYTRM